jgi:DNA mismatch repair protein MutS
VPAKAARWGAFSSIHTRIGAHDAIARGQSTFMVEMVELAHLLRHADSRSLILLDEIGRGTSTYDGISVAGSTLEYLDGHIGARTLFATHYHELTSLPKRYPLTMANAHMGVEGDRTEFRFQYLLKAGPSNDSFGIQVADLAGLPKEVITRAWGLLEELEDQGSGLANAHPIPHGPTDGVLAETVSPVPTLVAKPTAEKRKRPEAGSRIKPSSNAASENQLALF